MLKTYRLIQVGTGGRGRGWRSRFIPPHVASGRIEVVAAVDVNPEAFGNAQTHLGVPPEKCYTDLQQRYWVDAWLLEQYLDWLDGGPPMATKIEANVQSVALIFSAIESSRTDQPVKVQEFLQAARERERMP